MAFLIAAYVVVGAALAAYALWLERRRRALLGPVSTSELTSDPSRD
jgi:hypothetical protein